MWQQFFDAWQFFADAFLTGWIVALTLALVGVFAVAQRQQFVGVAAAQASTLGLAVAFAIRANELPDHHGHHGLPWLLGVTFACAATLLTGRANGHGARESLVAWVFLVGSSGSVLLLSHSPHGLEQVEQLMFSSLIGADRHDVVLFGILLAITAIVTAVWHRPMLLVATDPAFAVAVGVRVKSWALAISLWTGLTIGNSIHSTGTLFTFGELVLPAIGAKLLCSRMRDMLWFAPAFALVTSFAAFVLASGLDYPPAQFTVALQAIALVPCVVVRAIRPR